MPWLNRLSRLALTLGILGGLLAWDPSPSLAKEEPKFSGKPNPPPPTLESIPVLGTVPVGRHPLGVAIRPGNGHAVVANRNSKNVSVVDLVSQSVVGDIEVGAYPIGVAVHPLEDLGVVTLGAEHAVAVFDPDHFTVLRKIAVGRNPWGVAIDPGLNLAVVANRKSNSVSLVDLRTLVVTAEISVGRKPSGVAVNPVTHTAAIANYGDGTVTLLDLSNPAHPAIAGVISLPRWAHHRFHDGTDDECRGKDRDDKCHGKRSRPLAVAFDYDPSLSDRSPNRLVVADPGAGAVHIVTLDASNLFVEMNSLPVGKKPTAVAVNPGKDYALVTSDKDDVFAVTLTSPALIAVGDVGKHPRGVAIDPDTCRSVVTNFHGKTNPPNSRGSNTVSILGWGLGAGCADVLRIFALSPSTVVVNSQFTLTITGIGFGPDSTVNIGGSMGLVPATIAPGVITIPYTAPATPGPLNVSVTLTSSGRTSNSLPLQVTLLMPALTSVSPSTAVADGNDLPATLTGQNFAPGAVALFDGQAIPTTFVSSQSLSVIVPGFPGLGLTLRGGTFQVQVVNPDGARSNTLPVVLLNPTPVISLILPNNVVVGVGDTTVLVNGEGFVAQRLSDAEFVSVSQVFFRGAPVAAIPVLPSPTRQISITIPAALLQTPGTYSIEVVNPLPGGGSSLDGSGTADEFFVYPNTLPPSVSVATLTVPEGDPDQAAVFTQGTQVIGAVTIPWGGLLRLLDITDPANPSLLGPAVTLTTPGYGAVGDLAVNPSTKRLVAALLSDAQVAVVDASTPASPTLVTKVPVGSFPFGVAVDEVNNRAVVTNLGDLTLSVVNLFTLTEVTRISLEPVDTPAFVAVNPQTNMAAVVDQPGTGPGDLLLVDLTAGQVAKRIRVGRSPSAVAINPLTNTAVVANQDDNTISIINLATGVVTATLPVGQEPAGVAIDPATNTALIANFLNNQIIAVNLATNATVTLQLGLSGTGAPLDIAWQPDSTVGIALLTKLVQETGVPTAIVLGIPFALFP